MARCDDDMVEVQNRLGPRDPDEATCSIAGELSAMRAVIRHMTDGMLTKEQLAFIEVLYDKYKVNLSMFDEYVVNHVQTLANKIIPHIVKLNLFHKQHTVAPPGSLGVWFMLLWIT